MNLFRFPKTPGGKFAWGLGQCPLLMASIWAGNWDTLWAGQSGRSAERWLYFLLDKSTGALEYINEDLFDDSSREDLGHRN